MYHLYNDYTSKRNCHSNNCIYLGYNILRNVFSFVLTAAAEKRECYMTAIVCRTWLQDIPVFCGELPGVSLKARIFQNMQKRSDMDFEF